MARKTRSRPVEVSIAVEHPDGRYLALFAFDRHRGRRVDSVGFAVYAVHTPEDSHVRGESPLPRGLALADPLGGPTGRFDLAADLVSGIAARDPSSSDLHFPFGFAPAGSHGHVDDLLAISRWAYATALSMIRPTP